MYVRLMYLGAEVTHGGDGRLTQAAMVGEHNACTDPRPGAPVRNVGPPGRSIPGKTAWTHLASSLNSAAIGRSSRFPQALGWLWWSIEVALGWLSAVSHGNIIALGPQSWNPALTRMILAAKERKEHGDSGSWCVGVCLGGDSLERARGGAAHH